MAAVPQRRARIGPLGRAFAPLHPYVRYGLGAVGVLGLLLGGIAVFTTLNQAGAFALLIGGVIFVLFALAGELPTGPGAAAGGRRRDEGALVDLLRSSDPHVRMAAAEAVLDGSGPETNSVVAREAALGVLLERDLIRRLVDLIRRGGFTVQSEGVTAGTGNATADVVVSVNTGGKERLVPIAVKTASALDGPHTIQRMGAVATAFQAHGAVLLYTGVQSGEPPLGSVTPFGDVQIFTAFSPRLNDEQAVLAAVARAAEAKPAPRLEIKAAPEPESPAPRDLPPVAHTNGSVPAPEASKAPVD